jgi:hypothetical protein
MKYLSYILVMILAIASTSCKKDLLNNQPMDQYSDAVVWKDSALVVLYVNGIYSNLPSEYESPTEMLSNYADESGTRSLTTGSSVTFNQNLTISSTSPFNSLWTNYYTSIRQCNVFMDNINQLNATPAFKNRLSAEVRFLRALYYHFLQNYFGRFPILKQTLNLGDNLYVQRSSDAECTQYIAAELNAAAAALPLKYTGAQVGRATKGAALALLSRVYLYAGQWQQASDAAAAVMALNTYSLFPDYAGTFYQQNENNSEVIFDKQYLAESTSLQYSIIDFYGQSPYFTGTTTGDNDPTGNLVDSYEMKDGSKFSWSNPAQAANPYANRDPRMDASVIHDGSVWMNVKVDMKRGTLFNPNTLPSTTGYWMRKFLNPTYVNTSTSYSGQNFIILRYAEVLLNYAEAQLNLGNAEVARTYVNMIRARSSVNMPPISAADFNMERYRNERRVELALEGTRLWDINRWKIGPQTRGANITGVTCVDVAGVRTYQNVVVQQSGLLRIFVDRMYLFPIPLVEIQKYPASTPLDQNPGW